MSYITMISLFCRVIMFFEIFTTVVTSIIDAGFGENRAVFLQPPFTNLAFYPVLVSFYYMDVFLTFFTPVAVTVFVRITSVRIVNHFLEIILHRFGFLFLLLGDWRTSENLSMKLFRYPSWP